MGAYNDDGDDIKGPLIVLTAVFVLAKGVCVTRCILSTDIRPDPLDLGGVDGGDVTLYSKLFIINRGS